MAGIHFLAAIPLLILSSVLPSAALEPALLQPKPIEVVVEGTVFCQSCNDYGTWNLNKAKPIESAIVGVICKDHRNRVSFYKTFTTGKYGYFYAVLRGFRSSQSFLDHPLHACKVRLVSSPLSSCNLLTNVNYGLYGAPLRYENKRLVRSNYEAVIYAAGPLAFRPAKCVPKAEP
ncbi:pistil-specific extensin-like protein [Dorcoceras hygrometricum]|uniref:Pistil-specific extensin-like protein n=1 Tax=Dorcoceras hygrometricum TaxID=472368 RepID=A0A2Z7AF73_9LAMI|nr:pistil-specific extensin-like protein [Dorcoceras hygrometricum]KZV17581.1 pistil-specific extensin-like protein [Dorcoceras hygrometricum]